VHVEELSEISFALAILEVDGYQLWKQQGALVV